MDKKDVDITKLDGYDPSGKKRNIIRHCAKHGYYCSSSNRGLCKKCIQEDLDRKIKMGYDPNRKKNYLNKCEKHNLLFYAGNW